MHVEVEQKYRVDEHQAVVRQLGELGAAAVGKHRQIDTYFAHPGRDFAATDEALRIRRIGDRNVITYKGPKLDTTTKTRREVELEIAQGDTGAALGEQLLVALGFSRVAQVCKLRQGFHFVCGNRQVEIAVDEVDQLGRFVELEIVATEEEQIDVAREILAHLATDLGLSQIERRSYLELLLD